jgi:hypothetical protein
MAQQKKASKIGRNERKCLSYRTRKGATGSKKPRKPGSNRQQRSYIEPMAAAQPVSRALIDVGFPLPNGGSRLVDVPARWAVR